MSENTKIEWCDATWNPWEGCQKVGPGCDNCYAEARNARFAGGTAINWGPGAPRRRTSTTNWRKPIAWNAAPFYRCSACDWRGSFKVKHKVGSMRFFQCPACDADVHAARRRVFCSSLADVFDNEVDPQWRRDLFDLIELTPNLDWLLLTKRIGNVVRMLPSHDWAMRPNVWLGVTVVNQEEADRDIPKLLATPARMRFLSMEPLLGPVNLAWTIGHPIDIVEGFLRRGMFSPGLETLRPIDWVIVGGESGPNARPMHPDWARSLREQCQVAGVPFLFKQWGEWVSVSEVVGPGEHFHFSDGATVRRTGKKAAGRLLGGRTWDQFPKAVA